MLLDQTLQIVPVVPWLELRRVSSGLIQRRDDDKQAALVHGLGIDLIMLKKLHENLIFLLFAELIGDGLAVEVKAVDVVGRKEEDMHHVVVKEIGK